MASIMGRERPLPGSKGDASKARFASTLTNRGSSPLPAIRRSSSTASALAKKKSAMRLISTSLRLLRSGRSLKLRLCFGNELIELHQHRLGADIGFTKYLRSKRALVPHLLVLAVVENACDGSLQTLGDLVTRVVSPVTILDQSHQCSHENAHRVIPPGRRETPVGCVLSEL